MVDWIAIFGACAVTAVIGMGFVLWEQHEQRRLARERARRDVPRRRRYRMDRAA